MELKLEKKNKLILDRIGKREIELFVEYIYLKESENVPHVREEDLVPLFNLLIELQPYLEEEFCGIIERKIFEVSKVVSQKNEFLDLFKNELWKYFASTQIDLSEVVKLRILDSISELSEKFCRKDL